MHFIDWFYLSGTGSPG